MKSCTILILTYKGKHHLEFLLPTVKTVIKNTPQFNIEVLIVDNGKDEATKQFVNHNFPEYRYEFSLVNDYLFSLNPFMQKIESDFTYLLNDDMKIHPEALNEALPLMVENDKLFAVSSLIRDWDDTYTADGVRELFYERGWLKSAWNTHDNENLRYTLYSGGGASVYRTEMFNQLGGFDSLYRPAYCEDLDLGHQAWHRAWEVVRAPKSILFHREGGTIKDQFKADELSQKIYKNQILWMLKNGNHKGFLLWFLLLLPYRILTGWKVDKNSYIALLKSLSKLPLAFAERLKKPKAKVKDEEIMKKLNTIYNF